MIKNRVDGDDNHNIEYDNNIEANHSGVEKATSKIQEQGNTTIPQSVRDYLKLDRGASIIYTFDPNGKVEIQKQDRFNAIDLSIDKVEIQKQDSFNAIDLSIDGDDNTIS